jgi:hypothetical protein
MADIIATMKREADAAEPGSAAWRECAAYIVKCRRAGDSYDWRLGTTAAGPGTRVSEQAARDRLMAMEPRHLAPFLPSPGS